MRKGIMALEGLEEIIDEAPAVDFVDAPENDTMEMNEAQAEVETIDDGISEASDTADTLEVIQDSLGESAAEGGMSEPEAKAVEVAVEHLCARLGFSSKHRIMPAMENFADKTTRVRATMVAMENVKDKLKSIWEAIVKAFASAVEWVQKYWSHLMDATKKYAARADALIKAAAALKSPDINKDAKVSSSGFAKVLNVGGTVLVGGAFVGKYTEFAKAGADSSVAEVVSFTEAFSKEVEAMVTNVKDKPKFDASTAAALSSMTKLASGSVTANKDVKGGEAVAVHEDALIFGQVSKYTTIAKTAAGFSSVSVKLGATNGAKPLGKDGDIAPLTPEEVKAVATAAKAHMESYKNFQATLNKIKKIQSDVQAYAKKAASGFGMLDKSDEKANSQMAASAAKCIVSLTSSGLSAIQSNDIAVTKATLDYCGASLKQYTAGTKGSADSGVLRLDAPAKKAGGTGVAVR